MAKTCVWCESSGPFDKEHIWPQWLSRAIGGSAIGPFYGGGPRGSRWQHRTRIEITTRAVCKACNGGWLQQMEDRTKPVLAPIATGPNCQHDLRPDEQAILATWAMKTTMHACIAAPVEIVPPAEYRRFHNAGRPADATLVMLALYGGRRVVCRANFAPGDAHVAEAGVIGSYAATLQAGRAVFFVVDHFGDFSQAQIDTQDVAAFATRIWPPTGRTARMPPNRVHISDRDIEHGLGDIGISAE
jgi:hypothetical protein